MFEQIVLRRNSNIISTINVWLNVSTNHEPVLNGMFESNRNAYVAAIRDFATGTQEGIEAYFAWFSASLGLGARAAG